MSSRDLMPRTVYLTAEAIEEADRRADELSVATGTLLRLILIGKQPPLDAGRGTG